MERRFDPGSAVGKALSVIGVGALLAGCGGESAPPSGDPTIPLPAEAAQGDELVAIVTPKRVGGDWLDETGPGALVQLQLGQNLERHAILAGGRKVPVRVSLGAWDGGALTARTIAGDAEIEIGVEVDPAAAGAPILGLYSEAWWNDVPLLAYEEDGEFTFVFTNEDGGTGLWPTLLMAQYGTPGGHRGALE